MNNRIKQLFAETHQAMARYDRLQRWREMQRAREVREELSREEIASMCGKKASDYCVYLSDNNP